MGEDQRILKLGQVLKESQRYNKMYRGWRN